MIEPKIAKYQTELFYDRMFNLHSLHQEKKADDRKDLMLLQDLTVQTIPTDTKSIMKELKKICLKYMINNPIIGEELYNPKKYDGTRHAYPFSKKILQVCADPKAFFSYLKDKRDMLMLSQMKNPEYIKKKELAYEKLCCSLLYEIEGPLALTPQ
jgi:hypothetical protein